MDKYANKIAVALLAFMFLVMVGSTWNDSATFDEVAHIGAGYSYLKYQDGRLNPEHPPLLKDLAVLPLLFLNLYGDMRSQSFWTWENVNDRQWATGNYLLYESGNDPDRILFASRLPIIILAIIFGWMLFGWVSGYCGKKVGLLTLFFFATSPTFIAHSRFVTTDLGAAFGFFLGIVYFVKFLEKRDWKSIIWLGSVLGLIMLIKFSLVLLLPTYGVLLLIWSWIYYRSPSHQSFQDTRIFLLKNLSTSLIFVKLIFVGLVALAIIWLVYAFQIWNYPQDQHISDVKYILGDYKVKSLAAFDVWLVEHLLTRPLGHYFYGFLMVARRTAGGNTAYFMGEVSSKGWWHYFPTLALLKEQLAFWIFAAIALFWSGAQIKKAGWSRKNFKKWLRENFVFTAGIVFIIIYWVSSIFNPLNIGVRHVLPTFPFIYLLTARGVMRWLRSSRFENPQGIVEGLYSVYANYLRPAPKYLFTFFLLFLMALDILLSFPAYLSYYNVLGGGLRYGYKVATDSNYDWGQDLKRLAIWAEKKNIPKVYLDYFGGGSPKHYLGDKYQGWWSSFGPPAPSKVEGLPTYFAVSLNSLMGNQARPVGDIVIKPEDTYSWLKNKTPVARAGSSILIYKFYRSL